MDVTRTTINRRGQLCLYIYHSGKTRAGKILWENGSHGESQTKGMTKATTDTRKLERQIVKTAAKLGSL